jgi:ABC-type transport system involved in multi-copper enzyme maturation permease subunit
MILVSRDSATMRASALAALAFPASLTAARALLSVIGPFCAAALGANVAGAEYQYGTWPWLLVRTSGRGPLFLAKIVVGAARIALLALAGILTFAAVGALVCAVLGAPVGSESRPSAVNLLYSFITVGGTMAFAAAVALLVTVATRSVASGVLIGASTVPLMAALRLKETALWNFYLHLQNVQLQLTGQSTTALTRLYEFDMSARASAWILGTELTVLFVGAYVVFRRQEIVY